MEYYDFFIRLLAALYTRGVRFIETESNQHHECLQRVVDSLGLWPVPHKCDLIPRPITGIFSEWDQFLLDHTAPPALPQNTSRFIPRLVLPEPELGDLGNYIELAKLYNGEEAAI